MGLKKSDILIILKFCVLLLLSNYIFAQRGNIDSLFVNIYEKRLGHFEIEILKKDEKVFIPIISLFNILRIKVDANPDKTILKGYFISKDSTFEIDTENLTARYRKLKIDLFHDEIINNSRDLFLEETVYRELFGLDIRYDDRRVEIMLKSNKYFPELQKRARQKNYLRQLERIYSEPELHLEKSFNIFNAGALGYNISVIKNPNEDFRYKYNLKGGAQVFGGDLETSIKGEIFKTIKKRDIRANIKFPFFNSRFVQLITLGDIQRSYNVGGNLWGVSVTNTPPERRQKFGSITTFAEIGANQEYSYYPLGMTPIYLSTDRDTSFNVTSNLYFGYNQIIERKYDIYGQEYINRKYVIIPSSMLPAGTIDYRFAFGKLRIKGYPLYSSGEVQYGATERITLGTGIEYSERKNFKDKFFPYTFSTVRLTDNFYGTAQFSPFIKSQINLFWQTWNQIDFGLQNYLYAKNKVLNSRNIKYSNNLTFQVPLYSNYPFVLFNGIVTRNILESGEEVGFNLSFGANFRTHSIDYAVTRYTQIGYGTTVFTSRAGVTVRATSFSSILLNGRFDHKINRFTNASIGLNIPLSSIFLFNLFAERNFLNHEFFVYANLSVQLPFVRSQTTALRSNRGISLNQNISGLIIGSTQSWDILFQSRAPIRRGYFLTRSFYDDNYNGIKDKSERYFQNVHVTAERLGSFGGAPTSEYDEETYLTSGEYYRDYVFRVRMRDLDEPFWVPLYDGISMRAEPNKLKTLNIPIVSGGIIKGAVTTTGGSPVQALTVILTKEGQTIGTGKNKLEKVTKTNSLGEFEFPAIPKGTYLVKLNDDYLRSMSFIAEPALQTVELTGEPGSEYVDVFFRVKELK
ncbi:MAG: carboxypeptidase-like regulatory domain-containing protein [Bacteroidota bacterium]|nr:carboxypeptidase-like regulatory domain-containing protein [Bacteroidota bacterium]